MGLAIVDRNGVPAVEAFAMRIKLLLSPEVVEAVEKLLAGLPITSVDGVVEISCKPSLAPGRSRIYVRSPGAPFVAEIEVRVLPASTHVDERDSRDPNPSPSQWMTENDQKVIRWELYNCEVSSLVSRKE